MKSVASKIQFSGVGSAPAPVNRIRNQVDMMTNGDKRVLFYCYLNSRDRSLVLYESSFLLNLGFTFSWLMTCFDLTMLWSRCTYYCDQIVWQTTTNGRLFSSKCLESVEE